MAKRNFKYRSTFSARELFQKGHGITYSDFHVADAVYTRISKADVSLETELGKGVVLKSPIIASPMDKVTNARMLTAVALNGGIGIAHYNHKDAQGGVDITGQEKDVRETKRFESGFNRDPLTVSPNDTIADVIKMAEKHKINDQMIDTFPVTESGKNHGKLVGLLRKDDYSRSMHQSLKVGTRMVPLAKLIFGRTPITLKAANELLWDEHLRYLPIVDRNGNLESLVTRSDLDKNEQYPLATKDFNKRLMVMFAVDTWMEQTYDRLDLCFAAGADGVVVDTSKGFTKFAKQALEYIARKYSDKLLMGGNISTPEAALFLARLGFVDLYRNGQGSGSICTTLDVTGTGSAGASGVYHSAYALKRAGYGLVTIADGGIRSSGNAFKALAIGAKGFMVGSILAGCEEAPGDIMEGNDGRLYKVYRGMGSKEAAVGEKRGYGRMPEGVQGLVEYRGSAHVWIPMLMDAIKSGFESQNCRNIAELHSALYTGRTQFQLLSSGAREEAGINIKRN